MQESNEYQENIELIKLNEGEKVTANIKIR